MSDTLRDPPSRNGRRWLGLLIVLSVLLIVVPAGVLWYAVSAKPVYWQPFDGKQADVREAAERFEQAMSSQLAEVRDEQSVWTVDMTQDQLNSWLASRLPEWGVNRGIDPRMLDRVSRSMVRIDPDGVEVAVPLERAGVASLVRLRYTPVVGEDKRVRLVLQDAHAGLVPLPITTVLDGITAYVPQGERDTLRTKVQSLDLLIPLHDGRTVSIIGMELLPGKLVLTCQAHRG